MGDGCTNINDDPWNYPATPNSASLETVVNTAQGISAAITGQPYKVYRITAASNGDVIQTANLINATFFATRVKAPPSDPGLETMAKNISYFFLVTGDFNGKIVGDVFILNDTAFGAGKELVNYATNQYVGFTFTEEIPLLNKNAARVDRQIQIFRPSSKPGPDRRVDSTFKNALPLVCLGGKFDFGVNGEDASLIPSGFTQIGRTKGAQFGSVPESPSKTQWAAYVMPLPGYTPRENDIVVEAFRNNPKGPATQMAQYRIQNPFYQDAGAVGSQLILEREVSQK